jgi:hypothetical protein
MNEFKKILFIAVGCIGVLSLYSLTAKSDVSKKTCLNIQPSAGYNKDGLIAIIDMKYSYPEFIMGVKMPKTGNDIIHFSCHGQDYKYNCNIVNLSMDNINKNKCSISFFDISSSTSNYATGFLNKDGNIQIDFGVNHYFFDFYNKKVTYYGEQSGTTGVAVLNN